MVHNQVLLIIQSIVLLYGGCVKRHNLKKTLLEMWNEAHMMGAGES